jgi:hypothetical protein
MVSTSGMVAANHVVAATMALDRIGPSDECYGRNLGSTAAWEES